MPEPTNNKVAPLSDNAPQTTPSTIQDNQIQERVPPSAPQVPPPPDTSNLPARTLPQQGAIPDVKGPQKSTFDRILDAFGPKPVLDAQGKRIDQPMTKKGLTTHILAGVITGMLNGVGAGAGAAANAPAGPAGTMGSKNMAALAAGGQAGTQAYEQMRNAPQQRYDAQQLRQYNTMKRNIDLHSAMLNLGHLQHQDMLDSLAPHIATYNQAKALDAGEPDPSKKLLLDDSGLTGPQALQKYQGKMSMSDFIPMGTKKMYNDDGSPMIDKETGVQHEEPIFAVINPNASMPATEEMKEQLKYLNPDAGKIPLNAEVRMSSIMAANVLARDSVILKSAGNSWGQELSIATGDKSTANIDLARLARENRTIRDGMKYINNYNDLPVDEMLAALRKDKEAQKAAPGVEGVLAHALGMDKTNAKGQTYAEVLGLKRKAEIAQQKSDEEIEQRKRDNAQRRELHAQEVADAQDIKNRALDGASNASQAFPNNWKDPKTGMNYDMSHPAMKLVDGTLAPPELSKRATKGSDAYNAIIKQADDYSVAKYGKPFDFQKADGDWKYYTQKGTKDTMNLIQSLTGEGAENTGGTLAQLQRQYLALGNADFSTLNAAKQWTQTHIGEPGVPAFQATLFGVSDEMAKILGGGTATVEGFKQAQDVLNRLFSDRASTAALNAVRGNMANRANGMVRDNLYLTKDYGKMRNPLEPTDIPTINGVVPIKQRIVNGQTFFLLPSGVAVDRRGKTVDLK